MSERDGYQPGVPCWIDTWQPDVDAAVAFYTELFGWEVEDTMPPGVPGKHFICKLRGRDVAAIAPRPEAAPPETAWNTYIWVASVEDTAATATAEGGSVVMEPFDSLDGGRIAILADPAGAAFGVWQPDEHAGAQLVNEPGAWSMSVLDTTDYERAKDFYGKLFGWTAQALDLGGAEVTMLRLPGYVGGQPEQPVPRDLVATIAPTNGDRSGEQASPRWSVDFWVDDVDATAATTGRLRGSVTTPPYDIPAVQTRQAVLADPQGAEFFVSKVGAT